MKKRKEDPKRIAAQSRRLRAEVWLNILQKGIAATLEHAEFYRDSDEISIIIDKAKNDLAQALEDYRAAAAAYEPYWRRRRIARARVKNPKPKKTAA
jgi:hypothetical protein